MAGELGATGGAGTPAGRSSSDRRRDESTTAAHSARDAALVYAARGWPVLPIVRGAKRPLAEHSVRDATMDAAQVRAWWSRWPDAGVGIAAGGPLVVLDVDPRHDGDATFDALARLLGALPETVTAETGGGGLHHYLASPAGDLKLRSTLGPGLDVKYAGGYVVAPPSLHASGTRYTWRAECAPDEVALATLPERWLAALQRPEREDAAADAMPDCDVPVEVREHRARAYVARMPVAVAGRGGQRALWAVACVAVRGMMLPPDRAMAVLRDYSARCQPPWSERELEHTHESAQCRSVLPWGYLLRAERASSTAPGDDQTSSTETTPPRTSSRPWPSPLAPEAY